MLEDIRKKIKKQELINIEYFNPGTNISSGFMQAKFPHVRRTVSVSHLSNDLYDSALYDVALYG